MSKQEFLGLLAAHLDLWGPRLANKDYFAEVLLALETTVNEWTRAGVTADFHVRAVLWNSRQLLAERRMRKEAD